MILALIAALQVSVAADSIPRVTLDEALRLATQLDPNYVAAIGAVENAEWRRRSAYAVFILPSITAQSSLTEFSSEFFNIGTGDLATTIVQASLDLRYDLFRWGGKFYDLNRARAEVGSASANEVAARFRSAQQTEAAYYDVVAQRELRRVAEERVGRAEEQFSVARARVASGAAVQTDSLQLLLELTRARVELLRQRTALKIARVQLGRRIGVAGPVDAVPLASLPARELPITEAEAVAEAVAKGPTYQATIADENAANAAFKSVRSSYLPVVSLFGQLTGFDETFFPNATTRAAYGFQVSFPIWNDGQREIAMSRARTDRDVARALRRDTELGIRRDAIQAYEIYNTARASADLAAVGVEVARVNLQVQNTRYRGGATTTLDLLQAQVSLAEADAALVQARFATRLALAGLESILGRRIFAE